MRLAVQVLAPILPNVPLDAFPEVMHATHVTDPEHPPALQEQPPADAWFVQHLAVNAVTQTLDPMFPNDPDELPLARHVAVGVGVGVAVGVEVGVAEGVTVGVTVGRGVFSGVGASVGVGVGTGVEVGKGQALSST